MIGVTTMDFRREGGVSTLPRLKSLCKMLRNNADKILAGEMSVTMTTKILHQINESADNLQDGLSPPDLSVSLGSGRRLQEMSAADLEEWNHYLQLVIDVIAKTPILVLHNDEKDKIKQRASAPNSESSAPELQPVRLGLFLSLRHLEINRVAIMAIQDLLKMRETLETLVVVNCFSPTFKVQDILEVCDGEVSVHMQWVALRTMCLRCNNLTELDGSLRLCPQLEHLDLSHNNLRSTEGYLGYLMELRHVDLSYNDLAVLPTFSATAKKKLRVLILAGNKINCLSGVEEMSSLEQLDISENLIAHQMQLRPVKGLYRLDKLDMRSNPLVLKKNHRLLALQFISTVALSRKFTLDGRAVKHKEIQNSRAIQNPFTGETYTVRSAPAYPDRIYSPGDNSRPAVMASAGRGVETRRTEASGEDLAVPFISTRKKKKKKAKRVDDIPDMDTSTGGELSSGAVTPSTTPKVPSRLEVMAQLNRLDIQQTHEEIRHIRRYYGENWLQVIEDQKILPRPAATTGSTGTGVAGRQPTTNGTLPRPASMGAAMSAAGNERISQGAKVKAKVKDDIGVKERIQQNGGSDVVGVQSGGRDKDGKADGKSKDGKSDGKTKDGKSDGASKDGVCTVGGGSSSTAATGRSDVTRTDSEQKLNQKDTRNDNAVSLSTPSIKPNTKTLDSSKTHGAVFSRDSLFYDSESDSHSLRSNDLDLASRRTEVTELDDEESPAVARIREMTGGVRGVGGEERGVGDGVRRSGDTSFGEDHPSMISSTVSEIVEEPEDQSEPFFVTLPGGEDHLIITVSPRYLVEKDINLVMMDKLDLQCLESVRVEVDDEDRDQADSGKVKAANGEVSAEVKVFLDFSYVRKDRRCRVYIVEDFATAQSFREMVQPFIDAKLEAAMRKMQVEHQCLKCSHKFTRGEAKTTVHAEPIPHVGSVRDFGSDYGEEKVMLRCPKCDSDHVVVLESGADNHNTKSVAVPLSTPSRDSPLNSYGRRGSLDQLTLNLTPKAHSTPLKDGSSSETQFADKQRKSSRKNTWKDLFVAEEPASNQQEPGDGPKVKNPAVRSLESSFRGMLKQESMEVMLGRRRSNAFVDEAPVVVRRRSDAVASPQEFLDRMAGRPHAGSLASNASGDSGRRSSSASGLVSLVAADRLTSSVPAASNDQLSNSDSNSEFNLNSERNSNSDFKTLQGASSSSTYQTQSRELSQAFANTQNKGGSSQSIYGRSEASSDSNLLTSSAESDIEVLRKRESSASVVVLGNASNDLFPSGDRKLENSDSQNERRGMGNEDTGLFFEAGVNSDSGVYSEREGKFSEAGVYTDQGAKFSGVLSQQGAALSQQRPAGLDMGSGQGRLLENGAGGGGLSDKLASLAAEKRGLSPVNPDRDSLEVTPMGSPLSSSVCSSLVSSVYHNSIQPNTSASDMYVTASDQSSANQDAEESQHHDSIYDEPGASIYDEAGETILRNSPHKASVSSEVEVLVEEDPSEGWLPSENDVYGQDGVAAGFGVNGEHDTVTTPTPTLPAASMAADVFDGASGKDQSTLSGGNMDDSFVLRMTSLDHDLKLYLMMHVFDNNEDFKFRVKTSVCQYMVFEEYEALVVVTSLKLYILRVNPKDGETTVEPKDEYTLMEAQPHAELQRVDVGLGFQTLRLEFNSDCSSYTLVMRDQEMMETFKELLMDALENFSRETEMPTSAIFNEDVDEVTLESLDLDVLSKSGVKDALRLYALGYIARGHNPMLSMAFVVSTSEICLVKVNHQWPSPKHQATVNAEIAGKQFTVLERQKINNIATLEVHEINPHKLRVTFFNESSGDETHWLVTMETARNIDNMIEALRGPWEDSFGVEMDVLHSAFDTSF